MSKVSTVLGARVPSEANCETEFRYPLTMHEAKKIIDTLCGAVSREVILETFTRTVYRISGHSHLMAKDMRATTDRKVVHLGQRDGRRTRKEFIALDSFDVKSTDSVLEFPLPMQNGGFKSARLVSSTETRLSRPPDSSFAREPIYKRHVTRASIICGSDQKFIASISSWTVDGGDGGGNIEVEMLNPSKSSIILKENGWYLNTGTSGTPQLRSDPLPDGYEPSVVTNQRTSTVEARIVHFLTSIYITLNMFFSKQFPAVQEETWRFQRVFGFLPSFDNGSQTARIIQYFNSMLGTSQAVSWFNTSAVNRPVNLGIVDLVTHHFVDGNHFISPKTDGVTSFMIGHDSLGLWFYCRNVVRQISKTCSENFILIGESSVLSIQNGSAIRRYMAFTPFDIVSHHYVQTYEKRIENMKAVVETISMECQQANLYIFTKPIVKIGTRLQDFRDAFLEANEFTKLPMTVECEGNLMFSYDGYVITSNYAAPTRTEDSPPDIFKMKFAEHITVDLLAMKQGDKVILKDSHNNVIDMERYGPVDLKIVRGGQDELQRLLQSQGSVVVELSLDLGKPTVAFKVSRIRTDKRVGNSPKVVHECIRDMIHPITEDMVIGGGTGVVTQVNLKFRRQIADAVAPGSLFIDIGTGRGALRNELLKAWHVICVEPDELNRNELARRLAGSERSTTIIPHGIERLGLILQTAVAKYYGEENWKRLKNRIIAENSFEFLKDIKKKREIVLGSFLSLSCFDPRLILILIKALETLIPSVKVTFACHTIIGDRFRRWLGMLNLNEPREIDNIRAVCVPVEAGEVVTEAFRLPYPAYVGIDISISKTIVRGQVERIVSDSFFTNFFEPSLVHASAMKPPFYRLSKDGTLFAICHMGFIGRLKSLPASCTEPISKLVSYVLYA